MAVPGPITVWYTVAECPILAWDTWTGHPILAWNTVSLYSNYMDRSRINVTAKGDTVEQFIDGITESKTEIQACPWCGTPAGAPQFKCPQCGGPMVVT
jgi:hypothetical protein